MELNLTADERSRLGEANLDAFFSHINALMDDPELIHQFPNDATVVFETDDEWVNTQNEILAEQARAEGATVLRVAVGQAAKHESVSKH